MITFDPLLLLVVSIILSVVFHLILPKGTTKNAIFIYCIVASAIINAFGSLLNSLNSFNDTPEYISTTIGTIIGYTIGGGLIGGVVGYNLGNLFFGKKFIETEN